MKILTRYILAELLKWFLLSLTVLTLIVLVFFVGREAWRRGLPPEGILRLLPCFLPTALRFAVPGTLLLATTSVYGRLAGTNEVVAIKAQGISPRKLLEPIWLLAFVASLATVMLNDVAVSWGRTQVRQVLVDSVEDIIYRSLAANTRYSAGRLAINVRGVDGRMLVRPTVSLKASGRSPTVTITAEEAELSKGFDEKGRAVLNIVLYRGRADYGPDHSIRFPDGSWTWTIPLDEASQTGQLAHVPSHMSSSQIREDKVRQAARIERFKEELAARAAWQMLRGDLDAIASDEWETRAEYLAGHYERLHRLQAEPHRRWSSGFSCLCFAWVGAPMAIRLRNREMLTSFFVCFLPVLIVWYPLMILGVIGAKGGWLPPWSVWSGNVLLVIWGVYLLRRVIRY